MASACVNNVGLTPGKFSSYSWLTPDSKDEAKPKVDRKPDLNDDDDATDFEFCLDFPVEILPTADELISDGKLMPMVSHNVSAADKQPVTAVKTRRITEVLNAGGHGGGDPFLYSPRAPRCASRWKEILGLKKLQQNSVNVNQTSQREKSSKYLKNLINRRSKSSSDAVGDLLPECDLISMSSRLSLSSSSSGHEIDDFPRLSLDSEKQSINPISLLKNNLNPPQRLRLVKSGPGSRPMRRTVSTDQSSLGITADSPRMNSSGKIVFQSLERSSSSPGSFNGGSALKHGGMQRSYSANVRVSTVLNVPVCSLSKSGSVFGQLFSSQQKRDSNGRSYQCISNNGSGSGRNRTDRV